MDAILVIGALGQIGSALVSKLRDYYPGRKVLASDIKPSSEFDKDFVYLDATDMVHLRDIIRHHKITEVYHLAAILSAAGEVKPLDTWNLNMKLWLHVLEASRQCGVKKVFFPSSIAVFGSQAVKRKTPQDAFLNPNTVYGMSKAAGEHWGQYYYDRYGLDVRSLRYPGVVGCGTLPGGGTTDYAVAIFYKAVAQENFVCFLKEDTVLPMMYIDDAIMATIKLMEAPKTKIRVRTSYNINGVSFSPKELTAAIRNWYPEFCVEYAPDYRQQIAAGWPNSIDGSIAQNDWGWGAMFDLERLTETMIKGLQNRRFQEKVSA